MNKTLDVDGIEVHLIRKDVKHLRVAVYPPDGRVRVSVPRFVPDKAVHHAVLDKLDWIRQQQIRIKAHAQQAAHRFVSGEQHAVFGRRCQLELIERAGKQMVMQTESGSLQMFVKPDATLSQKAKLLDDFYRCELKQRLPVLLDKWQPIMGRQVSQWGIKKMKTRWGSCNIRHARIWLNLELAKKPLSCLEYVLVHEMVHLYERLHNQRFKAYMDQFLPDWRDCRQKLNTPLTHAV